MAHCLRRDSRHLAWIRAQPCCVPGCTLCPIHPHHVRTAANSGTGLKPSDRETVPLCYRHHHALHQHGQDAFRLAYGVDLASEVAIYRHGQDMP